MGKDIREVNWVAAPIYPVTFRMSFTLSLRDRFLWYQFTAAQRAGSEMNYVAMFGEVDEGTANSLSKAGPRYLEDEGLPSDFYLRLTGEADRLLRNELL